MATQVHWHEGLFLQPHHLQRLQKSIWDAFSEQRRLDWPYPYGLIDFDLSWDALRDERIYFKRLRAIMPSGLEVDFPGNAELPVITIKGAFATRPTGLTVSLGVPLWSEARANSIEMAGGSDSRSKLIYRVGEIECADENSGENPKQLRIRKINARILLEADDTSDMEVLPLFRVGRSLGDDMGLPRHDPDFVPPCLILNASPTLRDLVRDLSNQVSATRGGLVQQIKRGGFNIETMRGIQFEQVMRLRTLNRFAARLPSLCDAPHITPFTFFLELKELLGELSALYPDRDESWDVRYDHDRPLLCFKDLSVRIRAFLHGAVLPSFKQVPFVDDGGLLTAKLTDEHFTTATDYFLGIKTKTDARYLAGHVEDADRFKLMPKSMAMMAVWGIRLKEERSLPLQLPADASLHYFRLLRGESQRTWEMLRSEKTAIVRWAGAPDADYNISLYMTVAQ